jgi:hypothetical protein
LLSKTPAHVAKDLVLENAEFLLAEHPVVLPLPFEIREVVPSNSDNLQQTVPKLVDKVILPRLANQFLGVDLHNELTIVLLAERFLIFRQSFPAHVEED